MGEELLIGGTRAGPWAQWRPVVGCSLVWPPERLALLDQLLRRVDPRLVFRPLILEEPLL